MKLRLADVTHTPDDAIKKQAATALMAAFLFINLSSHHLPFAVGLHVLAGSARNKFAACHDQIVVGRLLGEVVLLFNQ